MHLQFDMRGFEPEDYSALAKLHVAVDPLMPETARSLAARDRERHPDCRHARWVATVDGRIVGSGTYSQLSEDYMLGHFYLSVQVHPSFRKQGIGSAMFDHVTAEVAKHEPTLLRVFARDDCSTGMHGLQQRGFTERLRTGDSRLDVGSFDPARYMERKRDMQAQEIAIRSLDELGAAPDRNRKLFDLEWEIMKDIPGCERGGRPGLDVFVDDVIRKAERFPEGYLVASIGEEFVGLCVIEPSPDGNSAYFRITGVKPAYRRRGIGLALKTRAIQIASQMNHAFLLTSNETGNEAILRMNEQLGFVRVSARILFEKSFKNR